MKNKIIVIGSSNIDLIMKMDHLPGKGETVTDAVFNQVYGGKGANQAVAAARAGGKVVFVTCIGDDAYSPQMVRNFEDDGIDTRFVFKESGMASGHALIMIGGSGENYISVSPGANYTLNTEKIDRAMPAIDEAALIIMQCEIPEETIRYTIDVANFKKIPVLLNFAPARSFTNEVEAGFLSGLRVLGVTDAERAAEILIGKGAEMVIITLGEKGSCLVTRNTKVKIPAFRVAPVDTTAAGDTFCGSFAVAYIEGKTLDESLRFASAASSVCVSRMGAQPSLPTRGEIDNFLKRLH